MYLHNTFARSLGVPQLPGRPPTPTVRKKAPGLQAQECPQGLGAQLTELREGRRAQPWEGALTVGFLFSSLRPPLSSCSGIINSSG